MKQLLILALLAIGSSAFGMGAQSITVLTDQHYRGQNTVRIKRLVRQELQWQGESLYDYELTAVTIRAKSRRGGGTATMAVGFDEDSRNVPMARGGANAFQNDRPRTFNTIRFILDQPGQSDERWQMHFRGNIKIKQMVVTIRPKLQRIFVPMNHQEFRGNNTIFMKRELRDMGYSPRNWTLKRVVLHGKTRRGRGTADLYVNNGFEGSRVVGQAKNGWGFNSTAQDSYNRVRWNNVDGRGRGPWQIELQGRHQVRGFTVFVRKRR